MDDKISPVVQLDHFAGFPPLLPFLQNTKHGVTAVVHLGDIIWPFAVVGPPVMQLVTLVSIVRVMTILEYVGIFFLTIVISKITFLHILLTWQ